MVQRSCASVVASAIGVAVFLLSGVRRLLFKSGIKKRFKASVPVIVVGNISVGGNGKRRSYLHWLSTTKVAV